MTIDIYKTLIRFLDALFIKNLEEDVEIDNYQIHSGSMEEAFSSIPITRMKKIRNLIRARVVSD
jgi:hypothetical protein